MKKIFMIAVLFSFCLTAYAANTVKGTYTVNKLTTKFLHADAFWETVEGEKGPRLILWLSDVPLPAQRNMLMFDKENKYHAIKFVYSKEHQSIISGELINEKFKHGYTSATGMHNIKFTKLTDTRAEGRIWVDEPYSAFDDTFNYEVTFALDIAKSAPTESGAATTEGQGGNEKPEAMKGTPLPAGGGDPGKAYLELNKAILAGDVKAMRKFVPTKFLPDFDRDVKEMMELMKSMTATNIKVLGGTIDGNAATLQVEGKLMNEPTKITVTMEKEGNQWKKVREEMTN